jgi:aromatic ring-opening dioxygenase catalytic subunit (LigB family)
MSTQTRLPTYFISHGGGPWPWVPEMRADLKVLEASLADIPKQLASTPEAILVISGHWEESGFDVMSHPHPPMVYDYFGFPDYTYRIQYPAPGHPALAARTLELIHAAGLQAKLNPEQGFDHGTFAPLFAMYPKADMPIFQVALNANLNPQAHWELGRALSPLRDEGVLIVGSGLSYHNLRSFGPQAKVPSKAFDNWLQETLLTSSPSARQDRLLAWTDAPYARQCHPREEHLIPLMAALGAAPDEVATCVYHEEGMRGGVVASSFRFG